MHSISQSVQLSTMKAQPVGRAEEQKELSRQLVTRLISLKDESGNILIQKYQIEFILSNIQKHQIQIVQLFSKYLKDGFNLLEFVRFFLNIIPHHHIQNLYLAIGLIDLFRQITIQTHRDKIVLKDITDYMCEKILKKNHTFNKIEAKYIPFSKFVKPNRERKSFLQMPPTIYGETDEQTRKLSQKCIKTDSSKHSRAIIKSQFSAQLKKVFILDSLSESISVYDQNCTLQKKISPVLSKLKKQVIILSFAFSKRQFRIGAVLKDFSLKFWDHFNNFQYQKSISTTSVCQNMQTSIYFLQYFNTWITTDKTGILHHWNLLQQKPQRNMKCKYNTSVNDICEIASLNLIVVVQECKRASKLLIQNYQKCQNNFEATVVIYNFYNGHIITEIDLLGQRIPHTVLYSETYQVLFMSGLEKKIKIYQLHQRFMDASLKGELIGHQNLITSFTLISGTPMLLSADDKGKVKLWDFRSFTCLQTMDFSDKTVITNLLDMIDIGKIGVFGSRVNYIQFQDRYEIIKRRNQTENLKVQWMDFDQTLMEMYIFASKTLRVINFQNGQIKHIFSFKHTSNDQQFTVFRYFSCLKKFVLGNSKGQISIFSPLTGQLQSVLRETHQGALTFIQFDQLNRLYLTVGYDSKILIHRSSDGSMLRELKNNFNGKQISCIQMSVYHNLMIVGSNGCSTIYCWNYEYGKLIAEIKLDDQTPVGLHIVNGYGLLLVATSRARLYMFRLTLTSTDLHVSLLDCLQLNNNVLNIFADLKLRGKGKNIHSQSCRIIVCCQSGILLEYDISDFMKKQTFKMHCKEKSNYNPYRQGKQNFMSQLQKQKHIIFDINCSVKEGDRILSQNRQFFTQFNNINLSKLIRLEQTLKVVVGNDRRIKIWNQDNELLCDYNINYSLPYKWNLLPTSLSFTTQKIYYGIKIIQSIVKKYQNDISIGEAKNLEIRELFNFIQKNQNQRSMHSRIKMITQPEEISYARESSKPHILLLQNQYSRKDLNFQLVKRFNFTQIGGPTLKELDNIKKLDILQREWKLKEEKQEKEKEMLLRNIEYKARKNEEKEHIQYVLVKHKKQLAKDGKTQNQKVTNLTKKLNAIENNGNYPIEDRRMATTTFNKNFYRINTKLDTDLKSSASEQVLTRWQSNPSKKKSFQNYYASKFIQEGDVQCCDSKQKHYRFRDILTEMNGRVKNVKKHRFRRNQLVHAK